MRSQALGEYLSRLAEERGPLNTPEDEAEIARYMCLLGGRSDAAEQDARITHGLVGSPRSASRYHPDLT
jgi:antitoxin CcdA